MQKFPLDYPDIRKSLMQAECFLSVCRAKFFEDIGEFCPNCRQEMIDRYIRFIHSPAGERESSDMAFAHNAIIVRYVCPTCGQTTESGRNVYF